MNTSKYVPVRCVKCGWRDGLREDLVGDNMTIYCDQCNETQPCERIMTDTPRTDAGDIWKCPQCGRIYEGNTASGCANGHPATIWERVSDKDRLDALFTLFGGHYAFSPSYGGIQSLFKDGRRGIDQLIAENPSLIGK